MTNNSCKRFILSDGYISLNNTHLNIDSKNTKKSKKIKYLFLSLIIILSFFDKINEFEYLKDYYAIFKISLYGIGSVIAIGVIMHLILKHNWKNQIPINDLKKIEIDTDDKFETEVTLISTNNREKVIQFRTLENQVSPFIEALKKRNSRLIIKDL